jgi:hypothetical protein
MATHYEQDPARKKAKRQLILASEHFGVLEGLQGGAATVLDFIGVLRQGGYVASIEQSWEGGRYTYPAVTEKGQERLREGRLFDS